MRPPRTGGVHMHHDQGLRGWTRSRASVRFILALAAVLALGWGVLAPRPALAGTGSRQLHLAVKNLQFTSSHVPEYPRMLAVSVDDRRGCQQQPGHGQGLLPGDHSG